MDEQLILIPIIFISYIIGSFPTAFLMGKIIKNIDIREHGSGNVGATNVFRVLGTKWGIVALVVDILKGSVAIIITIIILPLELSNNSWILLSSGCTAFIGHLFPVWLKFKGGKGVAVAAGVFLALKPTEIGLVILFFLVIVSITRYVSLGSMLSAILLPILVFFNLSNTQNNALYLIVASIIGLGVILMHRKNINRLIKGQENKIFSSSKY